ncbi:radical SAM family heme chaperone HemW [Sphingobacterium bovistauri]|uniref:Heme chaperone HemW n=1 Tax=Sphingobacterium bovistauri TaxID=2781959 RepID=A0ABS7Z3N7_9SPHI|nr:radical SAM family heme chaperone HemW [Sphingobacterium bovistauri]MCA5004202.1 radical SAM family heme chaperone HemW [Sphingobacterium bovistauri]
MIYFHIPFCKQACHYCDFHFSTSLKYKEEMLLAMQKEIIQRAHYLEDKKVHSIYFGGGTPSILDSEDILKLIGTVEKNFEISSDAEITLEANPDDLTANKVKALRQTPINRFSIGIQSFYEEDLIWMNRAHNAQEADSSVKRVQDAGFDNITCDLIYGYPLLTDEKWKANMQKLITMNIPHISSYSMTVEKKTALAHFVKEGKTPAMDDAQSAGQMLMLIDTLTNNGFEHYEISNFAKNGMYAKHNTNYWKGKHYLGIGPSAHSFDGNSRSWNIANNAKYIAALTDHNDFQEIEKLTKNDRFNEYVMTSIRTMWGLDVQKIEQEFGYDYAQHILKSSRSFVANEEVEIIDNRIIRATTKGKLLADLIASELFVLDEK